MTYFKLIFGVAAILGVRVVDCNSRNAIAFASQPAQSGNASGIRGLQIVNQFRSAFKIFNEESLFNGSLRLLKAFVKRRSMPI